MSALLSPDNAKKHAAKRRVFLQPKAFFLEPGKKLAGFLLDMLFPLHCYGCRKEGQVLCPECLERIKLRKHLSCPRCKIMNGDGSYCRLCRTGEEIDGLWISADYRDENLAELIKAFKYSFDKSIAPVLSGLLISFITANKIDQDMSGFRDFVLVPVPLHKSRLRYRGFNQSELLASEIGKHFGLKLNAAQLSRRKKTEAQAKLKRAERLANLADAFAWQGDDLQGRQVILVDDVCSTRATLNNCAKTLKRHGAEKVWGLVLAAN